MRVLRCAIETIIIFVVAILFHLAFFIALTLGSILQLVDGESATRKQPRSRKLVIIYVEMITVFFRLMRGVGSVVLADMDTGRRKLTELQSVQRDIAATLFVGLVTHERKKIFDRCMQKMRLKRQKKWKKL